ncbi:MAG TPA: inositol 2-dehydrogenase [Bryobacteraceae bacterium]|nr:inositol 2-dehydrogenase [Bryobacteraceae bacterium]
MKERLKVGLIGLGRMGRVYAANLAHRVPNAQLCAAADVRAEVAEAFAAQYGIPRWYRNHHDLIDDKDIDAVVIVTPTSTHHDLVIECAKAGKAIFCEKPISLSLADAGEMLEVVKKAGVFFQIGFQRRFDSGYVEAKKKIEAGIIGTPVVLTATSRDPYPPPLEFCDTKASGGLIIDCGIHDFDLAQMYMGPVKSVFSVGGALAYPEMKSVGDIDNAIINMAFESGNLGVVHLSRNSVFGYDIRAEIWGTKGSLQIGYFRQTPILVMTKEGITHDVVPYFMERFESAYLAQIQDFVAKVQSGGEPSITGGDAVSALRVSLAATASWRESRPVEVASV